MKIEEAIDYFRQQEVDCEDAIAWAAADPVDKKLLRRWCSEREALRLALEALYRMQDSECNDESDG